MTAPSAPRRFAILAAPRTGSNWLCSMLDSHPEILCHHELFNPAGIHVAISWRGGAVDVDAVLGTHAERDRAPLAFLDRAWSQSRGCRAVGFKLNRGQNEAAFAAVLADPEVRKILLRRDNRLKTFASERIAARTGLWESYPDSPRSGEQVRIRVDLGELRRHIDENRAYYESLTAELAGQDVLAVRYEDLVAASDAWRPVFDFLAVGVAELHAETRKQNATDLREILLNFAEVAAALRGTELEAELYARSC
jgi:LPS sulfotransferase NodH